MKKITIKQYARSLYETVEEKSKAQIKPAIKNFTEILIIQNQLTKIDDIIGEFTNIWRREKKIIEAEAVSASELSNEIIKNIKSYIAKATHAKEVILTNNLDKDILGGVIIKYGDKVIDGSLRTRLEEIKRGMVK